MTKYLAPCFTTFLLPALKAQCLQMIKLIMPPSTVPDILAATASTTKNSFNKMANPKSQALATNEATFAFKNVIT